jgi:hypothetical protein
MIWFGNLNRILPSPAPEAFGPRPEDERMLRALEWVAERNPQLDGKPLIEALATSGWVDHSTAARLLPAFRHFDPERHFSDHLRRLSFRGRSAAHEFRSGIRCIMADITGSAALDDGAPEPAVRFRSGEKEGVVLAYPEVAFNISGATRDAVQALMDEMPDALVIVARNFDKAAADQLSELLYRSEIPGTLVTVNLLLGVRAITLRYQPGPARVVALLAAGRPLRSADVARLGDRIAA